MHKPERIQGTDGVRGKITSEHSIHPVQDFIEKGTISPQFTQLYAYAWSNMLKKSGHIQEGASIILGWDPRDPKGTFVKAAADGIRKTGLSVLAVGILPTPAIPMYMQWKNAPGSMMLTASHNPSDQQGIKLFQGYTGLKFLPEDDVQLTALLYELESEDLEAIETTGNYTDVSAEARELFLNFHTNPENSWFQDLNKQGIVLYFDASKGALTPVIESIGQTFPAEEIHYTNMSIKGDVNEFCGVADIEGKEWIALDEILPEESFFHPYETLLQMSKRAQQPDIQSGEKWLCGYVFDGDGDRCFRIDYITEKEAFLISSGDTLGFVQGTFLKKQAMANSDSWFMHTVESDLLTSMEAAGQGWKTKVTAVGDKWILKEAVKLTWEQSGIQTKPLQNPLASFHDSFQLKDEHPQLPDQLTALSFQVGFEESGHCITPGLMKMQDNSLIPVFTGNGLKTAMNSLVAIEFLYPDHHLKTQALEHPFEGGIKSTSYVYQVDKSQLNPDSFFRSLLMEWMPESVDELSDQTLKVTFEEYPEEDTMLYWNLYQGEALVGSVFVRNSGTEDKSALYARGRKEYGSFFKELIQQLHLVLLTGLKKKEHPLNKRGFDLLKNLKNKQDIWFNIADKERNELNKLIRIMESKEKLIVRNNQQFKLTIVGQGFVDAWDAKMESLS